MVTASDRILPVLITFHPTWAKQILEPLLVPWCVLINHSRNVDADFWHLSLIQRDDTDLTRKQLEDILALLATDSGSHRQ